MPDGRVIVTGGTGGLGAGVVERLLAAGNRLVVTWVVDEERERAAAAYRDAPVELRHLDVLDEGAFGALAGEVDTGAGGLAGLVHLVGGYLDGHPFGESSLADLDGQLALNLRSLSAALGAVLPRLAARGGGRVVAVSARAAVRPWAGASAYAASKAGVIAMVQAAQQEVIADGVCVNCIMPSVIDTPANRAAEPGADHGRWVSPREIGEVVAFLMSEGASAVTGAAIPVYGRA
ncbi:MAG: SDR family oxidoreductase [Thermoleophilia bacterium]|jgi:NAD(P)-dependent dehydrogenase (short-subunit alcohol dehydrogenase family)